MEKEFTIISMGMYIPDNLKMIKDMDRANIHLQMGQHTKEDGGTTSNMVQVKLPKRMALT